ncbi:MAG TPA: hypothetical protein VFS03_08775 [Microvirga sp.]|nr:hypothetical protein [Microvirga sp.]
MPSSRPDGHRPDGPAAAEPGDLLTVELEPGHAALLMEEILPAGQPALAAGGSVAVRMPADQALGLATALHRTGRLEAAERFYRAVLARDGAPPAAGHFFGLLLHATGRSAEGLGRLRGSMAALGDQAWAWNNLGNVLNQPTSARRPRRPTVPPCPSIRISRTPSTISARSAARASTWRRPTRSTAARSSSGRISRRPSPTAASS